MKELSMKWVMVMVIGLVGANVFAQTPPAGKDNGNRDERIESMKIAFISQQLNLTPQEGEKFWPVYNQYHSELKTLHQNFKADANGQLTADQQLDFEQKKLDLKKKYKAAFEDALGKDKVNQLYNLEQKFRDKLKQGREERMKQRSGGQGTPQGAPRGDRPRGGF